MTHGTFDVIDALADNLFEERPQWVCGTSLGNDDTRFLLRSACESGVRLAVEIGTASGFSTAVICHGLNLSRAAGKASSSYQVVSYDFLPQFYADRTKKVGDAARQTLPEELLSHILFRNPAMAADFGTYHVEREIEFLFIDANHMHPWPTLDLLAAMQYMAPGATVVLHDINLPLLHPNCPDRGAKYVFDGLDVAKRVPTKSHVPNIGSFQIPDDRADFEEQLKRILFAHPWQTDVCEGYLRRLGVSN